MSDRWKSKLGRRHPFLYAAPIPVASEAESGSEAASLRAPARPRSRFALDLGPGVALSRSPVAALDLPGAPSGALEPYAIGASIA